MVLQHRTSAWAYQNDLSYPKRSPKQIQIRPAVCHLVFIFPLPNFSWEIPIVLLFLHPLNPTSSSSHILFYEHYCSSRPLYPHYFFFNNAPFIFFVYFQFDEAIHNVYCQDYIHSKNKFLSMVQKKKKEMQGVSISHCGVWKSFPFKYNVWVKNVNKKVETKKMDLINL